ncbi:MAG TPA: hypothetical protein VG347_03470 [Verrucomicrobiae bacterium]|nr:hypothetical protein [Verrucomicrobiae bacterium]
MSAILFGVCGCCTGLVSEVQWAYAYAPFGIGWVDVHTSTGQFMASGKIPDVVYLKLHTDYLDGDTGKILASGDVTYNINGEFFVTGATGWPPDFFGSRKSVSAVSQPYTKADCINYALSLLDLIALLSPGTIYEVTPYAPFVFPQPPTVPTHFCYPSEAAMFRGEQCTNMLIVGPAQANNSAVGILFGRDGSLSNYPGDFTGNPSAINGGMPFGSSGGNAVLDGRFWVKKMAYRSPTGWTRETIHHSQYQGSIEGGFDPGIQQAVNLLPGEHIFLPSDAPQPGWVTYDTGAAPQLPSP